MPDTLNQAQDQPIINGAHGPDRNEKPDRLNGTNPAFTRSEVVAVLGGRPHINSHAYKVLRALALKGYTPVPINPFFEQVDEWICYPTLQSCPKKIDTITVYIKTKLLADLWEDILEVMPRRVILNPGSQCEGVAVGLRSAGIEVVKTCSLALLEQEQF